MVNQNSCRVEDMATNEMNLKIDKNLKRGKTKFVVSRTFVGHKQLPDLLFNLVVKEVRRTSDSLNEKNIVS